MHVEQGDSPRNGYWGQNGGQKLSLSHMEFVGNIPCVDVDL